MYSYVADRTQSDAPMRSINGLQARFAATSQLLHCDIWPIWLVDVPGVVASVRREFAVQINRFRNAIVRVNRVVVRSFAKSVKLVSRALVTWPR